MKESNIVYNAIRTPDGTVLESFYRHDYKEYEDQNGKVYMVDGGIDYLRRYVHDEQYEELSVSLEDGHDKVREVLKWGTYGVDGKQPLTRIILKDMTTSHIKACLDTIHAINPKFKTAFINELNYRSK